MPQFGVAKGRLIFRKKNPRLSGVSDSFGKGPKKLNKKSGKRTRPANWMWSGESGVWVERPI